MLARLGGAARSSTSFEVIPIAAVLERTWVGTALPRKEDIRFLTGEGEYMDDREIPNALHVAPVRSGPAHARIRRIDASRALSMPGVAAVVTGDDITGSMNRLGSPLPAPFDRVGGYPIAVGTARYSGEPVALVLAESPYAAEDGLAGVDVEFEPLEPVIDPIAAMRDGATRVHDTTPSNLVWERTFSYGDPARAFARADHVVRRKLHLPRFTSAPLETAAVAVEYDERLRVFSVWSNVQSPERFRARTAAALGVHGEQLHFRCPDIGGGFGIKFHYQWVVMLCWLARRFGRPVKWVEDRTGHLLASHHGNEIWYDAELAIMRDGTIEGYRARGVHDEGAYLEREPKGAVNQLRHVSSMYRFRHIELQLLAVLTNKCTTGPNRSYGKLQQNFMLERLIDDAARELGLDPVELRRRNLIRPEEMPYETVAGAVYDGGDYPEALRRAVEIFGYQTFRQEQAQARAQGRYIGCGLALGVEGSPGSANLQQFVKPKGDSSGDSEAALVRITDDGRVIAAVGTVPQGQGHETAIAQIVADELGVTPDAVAVTAGYDSWRDPSTPYSGTHASRFVVMGGGAVVGAARRLREKVLRYAAALLDTQPELLTLRNGRVDDVVEARSLKLSDLARRASLDLDSLPEGMEPGLDARFVYHAPFGGPRDAPRGNFSLTYAYSVTFASVDVDVETGRVKLLRVVCVHDCGRQINPLIVEGQVHGAIAHQVGAALFEAIRYDSTGQLLTSTFKDYLTPSALELPSFELGHIETPSLFAPLGARGAGEGAGTPHAAALNAVCDALSPFGVRLVEGHISPADVRELLQAGSQQPDTP